MTGFDLLIVGAGPAGLAAAGEAARYLDRVAIVDDNLSSGGQVGSNFTRIISTVNCTDC